MVALRTYQHLHRVSLRFHLDRQTGGLSRVIDRGVSGMQSVLRLAVFNVVPTAVELLLVTGDHLAHVRLALCLGHVPGGGDLCRLHQHVWRVAAAATAAR